MLFDSANPEAFWLDVTNAALGVMCLVCILALAWGVARDLAERWSKSPTRQLRGSHAFDDPLLGATMADGGEPRHGKVDRDRAIRN
jgi:hypothetical protein